MGLHGGRNLVLPKVKDFEEMGLRRSHEYQCMTYTEMLVKLQITADPLGNALTDYEKKIRDYAQSELFIVPDTRPQQDATPFRIAGLEPHSINVGSEGLFEKFAQFLYPGLDWDLPKDGSVQSIIAALENLPDAPGDGYVEKIMQWVNQYGLLFIEPMPVSSLEHLYEWRHLQYSDDVYRSVCAEYGDVPYFLSIKAFCELSRYVLKVLFVNWLYSQDPEIRKIAVHNAEIKKETDSTDRKLPEESIMEGYRLLNPKRFAGIEEVAKAFLKTEVVEETRRYRIRQYALRDLINHMSVWICIEMAAQIKSEVAETETPQFVIPLGEDKGEWAIDYRYQCSSLFGCMMLEALCSLNNASRYRTCPVCHKVFDRSKGRSDRIYCSDGSVSKYENCKADHRNFDDRRKRSEKKLEAIADEARQRIKKMSEQNEMKNEHGS